ncbi:MAG: hypothetical protein V1495_05965 [Pseudomonadota bacterium]
MKKGNVPMKSRFGKIVFALTLLIVFGAAVPSAFADHGRRHGRYGHGGWDPYSRPVVVNPYWHRPHYRPYYYAPVVRERIYRREEPEWRIRIDSDGDFGFSYGW